MAGDSPGLIPPPPAAPGESPHWLRVRYRCSKPHLSEIPKQGHFPRPLAIPHFLGLLLLLWRISQSLRLETPSQGESLLLSLWWSPPNFETPSFWITCMPCLPLSFCLKHSFEFLLLHLPSGSAQPGAWVVTGFRRGHQSAEHFYIQMKRVVLSAKLNKWWHSLG